MDASMLPALAPVAKKAAVFVAAAAIAAGGIGYAVHERHIAQAQAAQNAQTLAQLAAKNSQLEAQLAQASTPSAETESAVQDRYAAPAIAKPAAASPSRQSANPRSSTTHNARDPRYDKMQLLLDSQAQRLDAQGQRLDAHDKAIEGTRTDLENAKTELSGSIAMTHDELVLLEKKGERNYYEFDLGKSKQFNRAGPVNIRLTKANTKRQYADLMLVVNDRDMQQKHVNLYQPTMFYQPDTQQPVEIVINDISKDHIHGYVSAPKYRKSDLAAMSNAGSSSGSQQASSSQGDNGIVGQEQAANSTATRKRLPLPSQ